MVTRTIQGIRLVGSDGYYKTADGHYEIAKQEYETCCDSPHPVKLPPNEQHWDWDDNGKRFWRKGIQHEGGEVHFYNLWHIWNLRDGDYLGCTDKWDTLSEAVDDLARHLSGRCSCRPRN